MPAGDWTGPPRNPNPPIDIEPGWWWCAFSDVDLLSWGMVKREHADRLFLKREWAAEPEKGTAATALFEIRGSGPFRWRMQPRPSKAPRGADTEWIDLYKDAPRPEPGFVERVEAAATEAAASVKSAANVVLWGSVAIALFAVYRNTR